MVARHLKDISAFGPSVKQLGITNAYTEQREALINMVFPFPSSNGSLKLKKIDFAFFLASRYSISRSQRHHKDEEAKRKKYRTKKGGDFAGVFPYAAIIWERAGTPTGTRRSRWNMKDRQLSNFISNRFSSFSFSRSRS